MRDPIYKKYEAIQADCFDCKAERTFKYEGSPLLFHNRVTISDNPQKLLTVQGYQPFEGGHSFIDTRVTRWPFIFYLCYKCSFCSTFERVFFIWMSEDRKALMKVGQFPLWDIGVSVNLNKMLHEHVDVFKRGLICESQGYGIGAFAYYRRIVELVIDELLNSIDELLAGERRKLTRKDWQKPKRRSLLARKLLLSKTCPQLFFALRI